MIPSQTTIKEWLLSFLDNGEKHAVCDLAVMAECLGNATIAEIEEREPNGKRKIDSRVRNAVDDLCRKGLLIKERAICQGRLIYVRRP